MRGWRVQPITVPRNRSWRSAIFTSTSRAASQTRMTLDAEGSSACATGRKFDRSHSLAEGVGVSASDDSECPPFSAQYLPRNAQQAAAHLENGGGRWSLRGPSSCRRDTVRARALRTGRTHRRSFRRSRSERQPRRTTPMEVQRRRAHVAPRSLLRLGCARRAQGEEIAPAVERHSPQRAPARRTAAFRPVTWSAHGDSSPKSMSLAWPACTSSSSATVENIDAEFVCRGSGRRLANRGCPGSRCP